MELTREQQLFQNIINKAWEDETFKAALVANPTQAIESLTGEKVHLPEGKQLVVRDQTSEETIYINIPAEQKMDDVELNEEQLEAVAGGKTSLLSATAYTLPAIILGDPSQWTTPPVWEGPTIQATAATK
ncbi:NHLP leader peptide family RiPP precursor [uncultured Dokdonia sp.]|uniref:NHLP leader peptide family RiPP precursor n=1 Tax=uncultured Dokdonia sp. TaxID=575653 RepID=UPI002603D493|nr:NHLP leader peptide family RiPP precursor [uncultured Dokdonia sp.]